MQLLGRAYANAKDRTRRACNKGLQTSALLVQDKVTGANRYCDRSADYSREEAGWQATNFTNLEDSR